MLDFLKPPQPQSGRLSSEPDWPTAVRSWFPDGRVVGVDNSVWLYMSVPMSPYVDSVDKTALAQAAAPISVALDALATLAPVRVPRRIAARSSYREVHVLVVNIPEHYTPPRGAQGNPYLSRAYRGYPTERRVCLFGVRLVPHMGVESNGVLPDIRRTVESVAGTLLFGGSPMSFYARDLAEVRRALVASGLKVLTSAEFHLANAWWAHGRDPGSAMLVHADHLHIFDSVTQARAVARLPKEADCTEWPDIPGHSTIAFGCVREWDLPSADEHSLEAMWAPALLGAGAVCLSVRGRVEPPRVTRNELRRHRKQYIDDINERVSQGKMERAEQEELLQALTEVEGLYADPKAPPTLTDCSVVVAFAGRSEHAGYDLSGTGADAGVVLSTLVDRQRAAMADCWMASKVRANPYLHDLPGHVVSAAGLNDLSVVGDPEGALLGFTERDRQAAYVSPVAASVGDAMPAMTILGQTGSGKSVAGLHLAFQFAQMRNHLGQRLPVVFIDPKANSDHSPTVLAAGGQVFSLDDLVSADGIFDPLRFSHSKSVGVELASSMLMQVNPWGSRREDFETPLISALSYGVSRGASCTGEALRQAYADGQASPEMVKAVFDLAAASPMFRACVGVDPNSPPLAVSEGLSLIKVGQSYLNLPEAGTPEREMTQQQRVAVALVRMMVFGSAMALTGREGVLFLDEAWVMLTAGRAEVDRLGRLARSQQVLPILLTQKTTDALNAGLAGYISRGFIMAITDRDEAIAALQLFRLEPTEERLGRITAPATVGAVGAGISGSPNWGSFRALRDPQTGRVLRGAIGLYVDLSGRAVPVEVSLPSEFLAKASTNPEDIRRRQAGAA